MLIRSLGREDPLEEGLTTHSRILAWRIPWTEEPGGLQSMGSQRVRHDWSDLAHTHVRMFFPLCGTPSSDMCHLEAEHGTVLFIHPLSFVWIECLCPPKTCRWYSSKESACRCRRCKRWGFDPWVRKIPWRRKWQPTPVFLLGNPTDRGPWQATVHGIAESDTTEWLSTCTRAHTHTHTHTYTICVLNPNASVWWLWEVIRSWV